MSSAAEGTLSEAPVPGDELLMDDIRNAGIVWMSYVPWAKAWIKGDSDVWVKRQRTERFLDPRDQEASVNIRDHGLLYGGAVFEGINFFRKGVLLLDGHIDRMYDGAETLGIKMPYSREEFRDIILETVRRSGLEDGYIRPVLTRGSGKKLGLDAPCPDPTLFVYVCPPVGLFTEKDYKSGLSVTTADRARISKEEMDTSRLKYTNYAQNTAAKKKAKAAGFGDALLFARVTIDRVPDGDGTEREIVKRYLSEASAANVFVVTNEGMIKTPSLACNCLDGETRRAVIKLAKEKGFTVEECFITQKDLKEAAEIFETGTAAGIIAITKIDGEKVGAGTEGKITQQLRNAFDREVVPKSLTSFEKPRKIPSIN